jgi:transposase
MVPVACRPANMKEMKEKRMISVGIDVHKKRCQACLKDQDGHLIEELSFQNNEEGITQLRTLLATYPEAKVALESTGNLWTRIYDELQSKPTLKVILTNPYNTRIIAEAKIKNDRMDARVLADLVRADLVAESYVPEKAIREQRALLRQRRSLVEDTVSIKNRIHNQLDKYELKAEFSDIFGKQGREWLRTLQLSPNEKIILDVNLDQLQSIEQAIDKLTTQIAKEALDRPDVKLLMGFTGIDYYSAMLLINEIGDIHRFPSADKLVSYAGLAPSQRQSADHTLHGHITRQGNKYIRWILIEAAQHASRFDPQLKPFYERVAARRGRQRAIVAVARKLLIYIYQVLAKQEPYRAQRNDLVAKKLKRLEQRASSSLQAD